MWNALKPEIVAITNLGGGLTHLLLYHVLYYKLQNANILLLGQLQNYYDVLDMFHIQHAGLTG